MSLRDRLSKLERHLPISPWRGYEHREMTPGEAAEVKAILLEAGGQELLQEVLDSQRRERGRR